MHKQSSLFCKTTSDSMNDGWMMIFPVSTADMTGTCPYWTACSSHVGCVDTQLHSTMRVISGCLRPTQTPWLSILTIIPPHNLRWKAATDRLLGYTEYKPDWLVYGDVFNHTPTRLASRHLVVQSCRTWHQSTHWQNGKNSPWTLAAVVNQSLVSYATSQQPGFDLPRHSWSLLNHFRTGQGPCQANLQQGGFATSEACTCGQRQTMTHIVDSCPYFSLEGGLPRLHEADECAALGLDTVTKSSLAK